MVSSEFCIFVERPPVITIEGGNVHIEDKSGKLTFKRVMPIAAFLLSLEHANRLMADWRVDQAGKVETLEDWRGEDQAALP